MEEIKEILALTRNHLKFAAENVTKLNALGVELTLDVGTNKKTVSFSDVNHVEFSLHAKINQEL